MPLDPSLLIPNASLLQSIAQPKPIPSPIELQSQQLALQNARLQSQSSQLELQQQQRALQAQQAMAQAMQGAMTTQPDGSVQWDPTKVSNSLIQSGRGDLVPGTLKNFTEFNQSAANLKKTNADIAQLQDTAQKAHTDMVGLLADGIQQHGYSAPAMISAVTMAGKYGLNGITPDRANAIVQDILSNPDPAVLQQKYGPQIQQWVNGSEAAQKLINERQTATGTAQRGQAAAGEFAMKQRQQAIEALSNANNAGDYQATLQNLRAGGMPDTVLKEFDKPFTPQTQQQLQALVPDFQAKQTEAFQKQIQAAGQRLLNSAGKDPATWAAALQKEPPQVQQYYASLGPNPTLGAVQTKTMTIPEQVAASQKAQEIGISRARLKVEQQAQEINKQRWGFEQAGGVSPQAQSIVDGSVDPQTIRMMVRTNPGLIAQAKSLDPNFGMDKLDQRYNAVKSLAPGGSGQSHTAVLALNTLIHHADLGLDTVDALKNGSFVPGNQVYNAFSAAFGQPQTTDFNTVKNFIAGEAAKVAQGGVPHEKEVQDAAAVLSAANSPDQLKGALQKLLQVAGGRMNPMIQEGKSAGLTNRNSWDPSSPDFTILQPDSKQILEKRGLDPNTMKPVAQGGGAGNTVRVVAPDGRTGTIPASKLADALKQGFKQQ